MIIDINFLTYFELCNYILRVQGNILNCTLLPTPAYPPAWVEHSVASVCLSAL